MSDATEHWEAWSDGLAARHEGKPRAANPHPSYEEAEAHAAWDKGWACADTDPTADALIVETSPGAKPSEA